MSIAKQLEVVSNLQRVAPWNAERAAVKVERAGSAPARYVFSDGSRGSFNRVLDERSRPVLRFEEAVAI